MAKANKRPGGASGAGSAQKPSKRAVDSRSTTVSGPPANERERRQRQLESKYGADAVADLLYFDDLFDAVPAPYYFPKFHDEARQAYAARAAKIVRRAKRSLPIEHPLRDPSRGLTVSEVAMAVWGNESGLGTSSKTKKKKKNEPRAAKRKGKGSARASGPRDGGDGKASAEPEKGSIYELRARLRAKIESLRAGRNASAGPDSSAATDRASAAKRKRKNKSEGPSLPKKNRAKPKTSVAKSDAAEAVEATVDPAQAAEAAVGSGDFMFGALTGLDQGPKRKKTKSGKKKQSDQATLKKLQEFEARLADMAPAERERVIREQKISAALKRAQGIAVKDDKKLLRKSIARQRASRNKSRQAWGARTAQVESELNERAERRQKNISDYQAKKKEKRVAKMQKKRKRNGRGGD